ncbi:MAG TPA: hypothetical protein PKA14_12155 [Leptospiraceae bacterium]|nr:hypothetical protein [Leptospiraceae bacterium]
MQLNNIIFLFIITVSILFTFCTDTKEYDNARRIAAGQYILGCTGGTVEICRSGCDARCGVGIAPLTTQKLDCAKFCSDDCTRNCGGIFLFFLNSK